MRTIFIILLFIVGLGCRDKCRYYEPGVAQGTQIRLNFFNVATGEPLIKDSNALYTRADIKVFDEQQNALSVTFDEVDYYYYYRIIINDRIKPTKDYNKEICTKLYVDFKSDQDTLAYCYSVKSTICGGSEVDYLNATYNGTTIKNLTPGWYEYKILK